MSPSGVAGVARSRLNPTAWSLSTKLVATVVGLFLAITVATSALMVLLLQGFLTDQLDHDVQAISQRAVGGPGPIGDGSRRPGGAPPGGGGGSLSLVLADGQAVTSYYDKADTSGTLSAAQIADLNNASIGPRPKTVEVESLGSYRVVAAIDRNGRTVISGLPTESVTETVAQVITLVTGGTIVGFALVSAGGLWLVRRNLAPLQRVAHTATHVARLKLDEGDVALAERIPEADTDPRTEVGQVGLALNNMLDNVEGALQARHDSEQRVRQFVADASHELRTPLASIRGYAELSRREREPVPASVTHALTRVES